MSEKITSSAILFEGVLNDDEIIEYDKGKRYELRYYTYANEWSNHEHIEHFASADEALAFYQAQFPDRLKAQVEWMNEDYKREQYNEWLESGDYWTIDEYTTTILDVFVDKHKENN